MIEWNTQNDYTSDEINELIRTFKHLQQTNGRFQSNEYDNTNAINELYGKRVKQIQQKNRRLEANVNDPLNTSAT